MLSEKRLTRQDLEALTEALVESVYEGRDGRCTCGCAGTHYKDAANVRRILRTMKRVVLGGGEADYGNSYIARTAGKRIYIVYPRTDDREV